MQNVLLFEPPKADKQSGATGGAGVSEPTVPSKQMGGDWPKETQFGTLYCIGVDDIPTATETPLSKSAEERSWVFFQQRCITRSSSSSSTAPKSSSR